RKPQTFSTVNSMRSARGFNKGKTVTQDSDPDAASQNVKFGNLTYKINYSKTRSINLNSPLPPPGTTRTFARQRSAEGTQVGLLNSPLPPPGTTRILQGSDRRRERGRGEGGGLRLRLSPLTPDPSPPGITPLQDLTPHHPGERGASSLPDFLGTTRR